MTKGCSIPGCAINTTRYGFQKPVLFKIPSGKVVRGKSTANWRTQFIKKLYELRRHIDSPDVFQRKLEAQELKVCASHFAEEDMHTGIRLFLNHGALPTLNLSKMPSDDLTNTFIETAKYLNRSNTHMSRNKDLWDQGKGITCESCRVDFNSVDILFEHVPASKSCNKWYMNHPHLWNEIFDYMADQKQSSMQSSSKMKSPVGKKKAPKGVPGSSKAPGGGKPLCILFRPKVEPPRGQKTPKCFLNVDEYFYHKTTSSQGYKRKPYYKSYTCYSCGKNLRNNLRFMSHTRHKVLNVWEKKDREENKNTCVYCYQTFDTPFERQCHVEMVHSTSNSQTTCKICDVYFETEQLFLQHMKTLHCRKEMPYVCYVCNFRSSFYNDVIQHFKHAHSGTSFLQCCFCLQVRNAQNNFLTHTIAHVKKTIHCRKCRLQFITQEELTNHEEEHETNMVNTDLMSHEVYVHINYEKVPEQKEKVKPDADIKIKIEPSPVKIKAQVHHKRRSTKSSSSGGEVNQREGSHYTTKPKEAKLPSYLQPVVIPRSLNKVGITETGYNGPYNCWECKNLIGYSGKHFRYHFGAVYECKCCSYMTSCKYACDNHIILKHVEPGLAIDFESPGEDEEFVGFTEDDIFLGSPKKARTVATEKAMMKAAASIKVEPGVHNEIFAASFETKQENESDDDNGANIEPMENEDGHFSADNTEEMEVQAEKPDNDMEPSTSKIDNNEVTPAENKGPTDKPEDDTAHGKTDTNFEKSGYSKSNIPKENDEDKQSAAGGEQEAQADDADPHLRISSDDVEVVDVDVTTKEQSVVVQDFAASMDVSSEQVVEDEDSKKSQMEKQTMKELEALVLSDAEISRLCATKPLAKSRNKATKEKDPAKIKPKHSRKQPADGCFPDELDEKGWENFFKKNPQLASSSDYPYKFTFTKTGLKPLPKELENATEKYKEDLNLGAKELVLTANAVKASGDQLMSKLPAKYLLINDPKDNKILLTPVGNNKDLMQMPRPPTHLRFSLITATSVVVQWSHPQYCTFTQYKIVFKGVKSPTSKILPPNQTIVRLIDLVPDTTYDVKVYSLCKNIQSYFVQGGFQTLKKDEIVIKTQPIPRSSNTISYNVPTTLIQTSGNAMSSPASTTQNVHVPVMLQNSVAANLNNGRSISLPISVPVSKSHIVTHNAKSFVIQPPKSLMPTSLNVSSASASTNISNTKMNIQGQDVTVQGPKMLAPHSSNSNVFTLVPSQQTVAKLKKKATARKTVPTILRRHNSPLTKKPLDVITLSSDEDTNEENDKQTTEPAVEKADAASSISMQQTDDAGQVNIVSSSAEKDAPAGKKANAEANVSSTEVDMKQNQKIEKNDPLCKDVKSTTISMDENCIVDEENETKDSSANKPPQEAVKCQNNETTKLTEVMDSNTVTDKTIPTANLSSPVKNINSFDSVDPPTLDDLKTAMCEDVF